VALGFGPFFAAQVVLRWREKFPDVQLRLVEGLRHSTGPMVRDATLDMNLAPRPPQGQDDPASASSPSRTCSRSWSRAGAIRWRDRHWRRHWQASSG
jgi:hypothetical protein